MSHRPVCVKCQVELRPEKNETIAVYNDGEKDHEAFWCDLWKCPTCGYQVLFGFGVGPFMAHYEADFKERLARFEANPKNLIIRYGYPTKG